MDTLQMMHSTLDILLTSDPGSGTDMTGEWESECDSRNSPKIKFPLKLIDHTVEEVDLDFSDPKVSQPKDKKIDKKKNQINVVKISGKNKKDKKTNLF
jgi:hypothetical protein